MSALAIGACDSRPGLDGSGFSLTIRVEDAAGKPVPGLTASIETLFQAPYQGPGADKGGDVFLLTTYPSPFREEGIFGIGLSGAADATVQLFSIDSALVATLVDERLEVGSYAVPIDGDALPGGAYLLRAEVDGITWDRWLLATDGPANEQGRISRALGPLGSDGAVTLRDRRAAPGLYGYPGSFILINEISTQTGRAYRSAERSRSS